MSESIVVKLSDATAFTGINSGGQHESIWFYNNGVAEYVLEGGPSLFPGGAVLQTTADAPSDNDNSRTVNAEQTVWTGENYDGMLYQMQATELKINNADLAYDPNASSGYNSNTAANTLLASAGLTNPLSALTPNPTDQDTASTYSAVSNLSTGSFYVPGATQNLGSSYYGNNPSSYQIVTQSGSSVLDDWFNDIADGLSAAFGGLEALFDDIMGSNGSGWTTLASNAYSNTSASAALGASEGLGGGGGGGGGGGETGESGEWGPGYGNEGWNC